MASSSAPDTTLRIVALIPAHDEGPRIRDVVTAVAEHLPVLVVDDGSADDTAERARSAGATVIEQRPNQGKGAALRTGFRQALEDGVDAVVTLDGDGQHDAADLPSLLAAFLEPNEKRRDLVIGRRNFRHMPTVRRLSNELGRLAFSWAVGRPIPDNQSGYRVVSRRLMEATIASDEPGFEFEVEVITTCIRLGGGIAWVPIRTIYAGGASHIRPLHHLVHFLRIVLEARRTSRSPLS